MIADQSYNILFGLSKCLSIIIMAHNMSAAPFIYSRYIHNNIAYNWTARMPPPTPRHASHLNRKWNTLYIDALRWVLLYLMHFIGVVTSLTKYVCAGSAAEHKHSTYTQQSRIYLFTHNTRASSVNQVYMYVQWTTNKSIKIFFVLIFYWHVWAYRATKCRSLYRVCIWINKFLDNERHSNTCRGAENIDDDGLLLLLLLLVCMNSTYRGKMIFRTVVMILKCFLYTRITLLHCILYDIGAECRCMISNTVSLRW